MESSLKKNKNTEFQNLSQYEACRLAKFQLIIKFKQQGAKEELESIKKDANCKNLLKQLEDCCTKKIIQIQEADDKKTIEFIANYVENCLSLEKIAKAIQALPQSEYEKFFEVNPENTDCTTQQNIQSNATNEVEPETTLSPTKLEEVIHTYLTEIDEDQPAAKKSRF